MFHFGLPSEGLDHSIMPTEQITCFNKLMYIGPSHDPLPLPLAKEVIYVDWMPRYWGNPVHRCDNENGKFDCNIPECLIDSLISQAKDYFEIEEEPKVEWSMLQYRPIAKITFKWKEMYNITKNGNFTELTYIFETRDFEMGTNEKLKKFSDDDNEQEVKRLLQSKSAKPLSRSLLMIQSPLSGRWHHNHLEQQGIQLF